MRPPSRPVEPGELRLQPPAIRSRRTASIRGQRTRATGYVARRCEPVALLEVSEVMVRFGGVTAVDGASLTARRGQITGLIGPNGAGKTTLFNVISGLQAPQHGNVVFRGRDLRQMPPSGRS